VFAKMSHLLQQGNCFKMVIHSATLAFTRVARKKSSPDVVVFIDYAKKGKRQAHPLNVSIYADSLLEGPRVMVYGFAIRIRANLEPATTIKRFVICTGTECINTIADLRVPIGIILDVVIPRQQIAQS